MTIEVPASRLQEIRDRIDSLPISDIISDPESLVELHVLLNRADEHPAWDRDILAIHAYCLGLQRARTVAADKPTP